MKYRTKPCEIEAIKWDGDNFEDVLNFCEGSAEYVYTDEMIWTMYIKTLEGDMKASIGDYIIKGLGGEFYPCKPDVFEKKYEVVDENCLKAKEDLVDRLTSDSNEDSGLARCKYHQSVMCSYKTCDKCLFSPNSEDQEPYIKAICDCELINSTSDKGDIKDEII